LRAWLPALIWLAVIAIESSDLGSARHTGAVLYGILTVIFGHFDPNVVGFLNAVLRKAGHMFGYGVLSFLLFRAWRTTLQARRPVAWTVRPALLAFFMTIMVAGLDEFHQSFNPARTGTIHDVFLDGAAALGVQLLLFAFLWNRQVRSQEKVSTTWPGSSR